VSQKLTCTSVAEAISQCHSPCAQAEVQLHALANPSALAEETVLRAFTPAFVQLCLHSRYTHPQQGSEVLLKGSRHGYCSHNLHRPFRDEWVTACGLSWRPCFGCADFLTQAFLRPLRAQYGHSDPYCWQNAARGHGDACSRICSPSTWPASARVHSLWNVHACIFNLDQLSKLYRGNT